MLSQLLKKTRRSQRIRQRIKADDSGRIRLSVHRTNNHIYAQLVDDKNHKTIASASSLDNKLKKTGVYGCNVLAAEQVGRLIAEVALINGIKDVVFDRGGRLYHGRIKALADAARTNGLNF